MMAKPEYVASGRVALDRRTDELVDTTPEQRPVSVDSAAVETEVEVLRSPAIAAAVVDELQLANRPGFGLDEGQWPGSGSRDRAIRVVAGGIDVVREGTSYAMSVNYAAEDPLLAARIVNSASIHTPVAKRQRVRRANS